MQFRRIHFKTKPRRAKIMHFLRIFVLQFAKPDPVIGRGWGTASGSCAIAYAAVGTAFIEHAVTGAVYGVAADDLIWAERDTLVGGARREIIRFGQCSHRELGLLKWAIWELTDGELDDFQADVGPHKLFMDFELDRV